MRQNRAKLHILHITALTHTALFTSCGPLTREHTARRPSIFTRARL